ncbi:hypothetical protein M758_2G089900 [Ceratodon purpureus]|nr:hypothetical protein M758_2G089900 [Ceratodon purpureus]
MRVGRDLLLLLFFPSLLIALVCRFDCERCESFGRGTKSRSDGERRWKPGKGRVRVPETHPFSWGKCCFGYAFPFTFLLFISHRVCSLHHFVG